MPEIDPSNFFEIALPPKSKRPKNSSAKDVLQLVFGYEAFRSGQEEIVDHVVKGGNALVLMTTGGGKSLCYQIPALTRQGMGLIISPLIPLMKDQVETLRKRGIRAAAFTHLLNDQEKDEIEKAIKDRSLDILYVSPERLQSLNFRHLIENCPMSLIAIDEAHVMSRWGHDFRESYLKINDFLTLFPDVPKAAFTATADPATQEDIVSKAHLTDCRIFQSSFNRDNLHIEIRHRHDAVKDCIKIIQKHYHEDGIIFCPTRKAVEQMVKALTDNGINCMGYHAGMTKSERSNAQLRFMKENGIVAVATIAFGMGIDKPNIRFVIHTSSPATAEAYYQEIGRAGRDGIKAFAYLLFRSNDATQAQRNILLRLDEEQEPEKRAFLIRDMGKLQDMLGYIESPECRKKTLLNLFGEKLTRACMNCDRCLTPIECEDCSKEVRLLVKTIASTGQKYGTAYIIEVMQGLKTQRVIENEHEHLSVYGNGRDLLKKDWMSIIRQTRAAGIIRPSHEGTWQLEETAWPLLKGAGEIKLNLIKAKKQAPPNDRLHQQGGGNVTRRLPPSSENLARELLQWRDALDTAKQDVITTTTLSRIISLLPKTQVECEEAFGQNNPLTMTETNDLIGIIIKNKGPDIRTDPLNTISF